MMRWLFLAPLAIAANPAIAQDASASHDHSAPASTAPDAQDHDGHQAEKQQSDPAAMDHDMMDHDTMDHGAMDHGAMNHDMMDHGAMDHGAMDHGTMDDGEMDHSVVSAPPASGHSMHHGHGSESLDPADTPGNALPPPVPTDHAADAYFPTDIMESSRRAQIKAMQFRGSVAKIDLLEYRARKGSDGYRIEGDVWYGGDIDRAVLAFDGEGSFGEAPESIEIDAYWRHALDPWFNLQLGARHDVRPDPERTYALIGIDGLTPYWIEVEAQAYVSNKGDVHFSATAMHDWRLTQRLVLEPEIEVDAALQDVPELGIGAGIEKIELSGRLRYEIERNFAPYVGVSWERKLGESADFSRADGESVSTISFVAGLRFWF